MKRFVLALAALLLASVASACPPAVYQQQVQVYAQPVQQVYQVQQVQRVYAVQQVQQVAYPACPPAAVAYPVVQRAKVFPLRAKVKVRQKVVQRSVGY